MIAIFIPIFLFTIGYTLRDIFIYNLIMYIFTFSLEYFSACLRTELGPKHALAFSMPALVANLWLLSTIQTYHWPLWFPALCGAFTMALYWQGYHFDFSRSKHRGQATKDVSRMYVILAILGTIAPFFGSTIVTYFGFNVLYFVVIVALALVFVPLLKQGEAHSKKPFKLKKLKVQDIKWDLISYGGNGVEAAIANTIWPLFVYIIVRNYQSVGAITSAALAVTVVVTYIVGKRVTNKNRHSYILTSSYMDSFIYMILAFVETIIQVATLNIARSFVSSLRTAPYTSEYYLHADESNRSEYIFYMESAIDFFKIPLFAILIGLTYYLDTRGVLVAGLLMGAMGAFMASLMPRAKCEMPYCEAKSIKLTPKLRPKNATN
jgi:hypothetical protein